MRPLAIICVALACQVSLSAGSCEPEDVPNVTVKMQRIPKVYRDCFEQVCGALPNKVPLRTLISSYADCRARGLAMRSCGRATIKFVDHQMDIYSRMGK